jgi:uncharacterized protein YnzC (UPF0291/DUF896 family)
MEPCKIDRLNELSRLCRQRELTGEEQKERAQLRREYVDAVKASLQAHLDCTYVADESGGKRKLKKKEEG